MKDNNEKKNINNNEEESISLLSPGFMGGLVVTQVIAETPWYKECINSFLNAYPTIKPFVEPFLNNPSMIAAFGYVLIKCGFPYLADKWKSFFYKYKNENDNKNNEDKNKSSIFSTIKSYYTTMTDYIEGIFGYSNVSKIAQIMYEDKILSKKMTNLFTNTKVHIVVYESKILNAFTSPGVPDFNPILFKLMFLNMIFVTELALFINGYIIWSLIYNVTTSSYNENELKYDPITQKVSIPLKELTCYISSSMLKIMDEKEIIAILLHEVGHNTMIYLSFIDRIARIVDSILGISITYNSLLLLIDSCIKKKDISSDILLTLLMGIIATFFLKYLKRRQEIYSDEFSIKCGYGKELESSFLKMNKFNANNSISNKIISALKLNIFDKFLHFCNSISYRIYNLFAKLHFSEYPDIESRINMVKQKTNQFNTPSIYTDRSQHLDNMVW